MRLRLKAIRFDVDFRKSELTNLREFEKSPSYPGALNKGETFLFVSKSGNQLIWILNEDIVISGTNLEYSMLDSRRWRIDGSGTWNSLMLQDYANAVGIELIGFKRFEDSPWKGIQLRSAPCV